MPSSLDYAEFANYAQNYAQKFARAS